MEGLPGSPAGPPQAKRPRLGEDAPHAPQSGARAPERGAASTELPRPHGALPAFSLGPLLFLPPLLGGPMPRGKEGRVGGGACWGAPPKRRRAPGAAEDEESPSPKIPRGQLRALSMRGTAGAPGAPQGMRSLPPQPPERGLWSSGHSRARPASTRGENAPASALAVPRAGRGASPLGAPEAAASPSRIFRVFAVVPAAQRYRGGSAWFPSPPTRQSASRHGAGGSLGPRSPVTGAPAGPAAPPGPAPVLSAEMAERFVPWVRSLRASCHVNGPLLLVVASVSLRSGAGARGGPAPPPQLERAGQPRVLSVEAYVLSGVVVPARQRECHHPRRLLTVIGALLETESSLFRALEMNHFTGLHHPNEVPEWKFRKLKTDNTFNFLKAEDGTTSIVPTALGNNWLLTTFKTSSSAFNLNMRYEHYKVRECMNYKEGNCVSKVTETCHIAITENLSRDFKKYHSNSFHVIPKDTLLAVFATFEKVPLFSNFGDICSIALSKRVYNNNASSKKANNLEGLDILYRDTSQFMHCSQINTTEHVHQANVNSQDTVTEKEQMFTISSFDFKDNFNCFLETEHQVKNCNIIYIGPNTTTKTQEEFVGNFLSEGKEDIQILIQNERKHPTESFTGTHIYQISNGSKIEREQKYSITNTNTMVCIQKSNLLMKRKPNVEDTREINLTHSNQNNTTDRNELQTILEESALVRSKLFQQNDESTEFVNQSIKTDLAARNNECPPDSQAECLSTETKMISDLEMKREFDIVLKELCIFCETGKEEETLANSRLFHPKNVSTEFNRELKTDLITRNNKCSPDITAECLSTETKTMSDFEMKSEFDIVLKELCMFHEIGKEEETLCIGETSNNEEKKDFDKDSSMEEVHQEIKDLTVFSLEKICPPSLPSNTITSVNMPKTVQSSFKWKKIHVDPEKELPHDYCSASSPDADLLHSPSTDDFEKAFSQNPDLFSDAFMEGRIHSLLGGSSLSHGIVRVYPLQTCRGPIRIGLSRKAKPRQLHPYLKSISLKTMKEEIPALDLRRPRNL